MSKESKYVWLLDAGHGGINPSTGEYVTAGKRSPVWQEGFLNMSQYFEGVGNRQIVDKIAENLDKLNIPYFRICESWEDMPLKERVAKANQYQKVFGNCVYVSIHSDAFTKESANGYSIYTSIGETKSDKIAEVFIDNMQINFPKRKLRKDTRDGDKDKEANFYVLKHTTCSAILIENFFMTNYFECQLLLTPEFQDKIALCHSESITQISFS
tara:strand:+ start:73 stop:711 length:639 start_codon:yes stop_codon:yes gene_type:complete